MRYTIYRADGVTAPYLTFSPDFGAVPVPDDIALTLEELADLCDTQAADRNNHAFVGAHRMLAAILHQRLGRPAATMALRAVAERGGLDYASGCGIGEQSERAAWQDFGTGLAEPWHDWSLTDDEGSAA